MKRFFLSLIVGVAANMACAQGLRFGIKGGLNVSKESPYKLIGLDSEFSTNARLGVKAGVVASYDFNDKFGVEADLMYSLQGYKEEVYVGNTDEVCHPCVSSHYLQLPLTFKYYPAGRFYVEGGTEFGYLLSKSMNAFDDIEERSLTDDCNMFDIGLVGGVGYVFDNNIFVNARYVYGLRDTSKEWTKGAKNRNFQVCLGYYF